MARVTVEDCLEQVPNRFALVHLAVRRARQLELGAQKLIDRDNKSVVTALREIAAGKVAYKNLPELIDTAEAELQDIVTRTIETMKLDEPKNQDAYTIELDDDGLE